MTISSIQAILAAQRVQKVIASIGITYQAFRVLKIQLLLCIVATVLLIAPGQVIEIYSVLAEDFGQRWPQVVMSVAGLGFLTLMLWHSGRWITLAERLDPLNQESWQTTLLIWIPRLLAIVPGLALGAFLVTQPNEVTSLSVALGASSVILSGWILLAMMLIFLAFTILRTRLFRGDVRYTNRTVAFGPWAIRTAQIIPLSLFFLVLVSPVWFPQFVGTLFLAMVFLGAVCFLLSWSSLFAKRTGFPLTMTLIALAVFWSLLDINDNHAVRTVPTNEDNSTMQINQAFIEWLEARPDYQRYRDEGITYPIYVVAAEGGGIYAAHHAASFLSRIQDLCPTFANHLFAVSGVSGGSVGSGVFTGLLIEDDYNASTSSDEAPCESSNGTKGPLEKKADQILAYDLLAPLAAATLAKDGPQRFLPFPIQSFDRARSLEDALQDAWVREGLSEETLFTGIHDSWSPYESVPAMLFNTTDVATGQRVVASPIQLVWSGDSIQGTRRFLEDGQDLSLTSAAFLSARFTYITPAGTLYYNSDLQVETLATQKIRLVDGGYFENSGVDTAIDIVEVIRPLARERGADVRLISLQYSSEPSEASNTLGEALSPIRALLATRVNRGMLATRRARTRMTGFCPIVPWEEEPSSLCDDFDDILDPMRVSYIHDGAGKLPLGWFLSKRSRELIADQIGWPHKCNYITGYIGPNAANGSVRRQNIWHKLQLRLAEHLPRLVG